MNTEYVLQAAVGGAIGPMLLMFGVTALAFQHHRKAKMGWVRTLSLFVVALIFAVTVNAILFASAPALLTDTGSSAWDFVQIFVLPLGISALTIHLLWTREPSQPLVAAQRFLYPPFYSPARINTPLKRIGYALFWVGALVLGGTLLTFMMLRFRPGYWGNFLYGLFVGWPLQFIDDLSGYRGEPYRVALAIGLVGSFVGFVMSYAYDQTIARFTGWVSPQPISIDTTDDKIYEIVWKELETNTVDKATWTRAFAMAEGNENKTRAIYINLRVKRLTTTQITKQNVLMEVSRQPEQIDVHDSLASQIDELAKAGYRIEQLAHDKWRVAWPNGETNEFAYSVAELGRLLTRHSDRMKR